MAKSLRSKWKRKMKAIKRVRYGEKELTKLKMILENAKSTSEQEDSSMDVVKVVPKWRPSRMARLQEKIKEAEERQQPRSRAASVCEADAMAVDGTSTEIDLNKNKFPIWLGSSKKKRIISMNKKINRKNRKEKKKARKQRT